MAYTRQINNVDQAVADYAAVPINNIQDYFNNAVLVEMLYDIPPYPAINPNQLPEVNHVQPAGVAGFADEA